MLAEKGKERRERRSQQPNQVGFHGYWQPTAGWRDGEMVIKNKVGSASL